MQENAGFCRKLVKKWEIGKKWSKIRASDRALRLREIPLGGRRNPNH